MADNNDQSKFVASLREFAKKQAAKDPKIARLQQITKALVDETRKCLNEGDASPTIGAYLVADTVQIVTPTAEGNDAQTEVVATLRSRATAGQITGGGWSIVLDRPLFQNGPSVRFIEMQIELADGYASRSAIPADPSIVQNGIPGIKGPSFPFYAKKTEPSIFIQHR